MKKRLSLVFTSPSKVLKDLIAEGRVPSTKRLLAEEITTTKKLLDAATVAEKRAKASYAKTMRENVQLKADAKGTPYSVKASEIGTIAYIEALRFSIEAVSETAIKEPADGTEPLEHWESLVNAKLQEIASVLYGRALEVKDSGEYM